MTGLELTPWEVGLITSLLSKSNEFLGLLSFPRSGRGGTALSFFNGLRGDRERDRGSRGEEDILLPVDLPGDSRGGEWWVGEWRALLSSSTNSSFRIDFDL